MYIIYYQIILFRDLMIALIYAVLSKLLQIDYLSLRLRSTTTLHCMQKALVVRIVLMFIYLNYRLYIALLIKYAIIIYLLHLLTRIQRRTRIYMAFLQIENQSFSFVSSLVVDCLSDLLIQIDNYCLSIVLLFVNCIIVCRLYYCLSTALSFINYIIICQLHYRLSIALLSINYIIVYRLHYRIIDNYRLLNMQASFVYCIC